MRIESTAAERRAKGPGAFTLVEVVISLAICVTIFSGIILSYSQVARRAEWSGYSLAAQALAIQQIEQAKAAVWDLAQTPVRNELANLPISGWTYNTNTQVGTGYSVATLDIPVSGTNYIFATNYVTVRMVTNTTVPLRLMQMIQVDTVWRWTSDRAPKFFTNTIATLVAPDNRDVSTL